MKKRAVVGLVGLAAAAVVGGTWAYWSQDLTAENNFETGKYDTTLDEVFTPPKGGEWLPGITVDKKVKVKNTGNVDAVVMANIHQKWEKNGSAYNLMFEDSQGMEYAAVVHWNDESVKVLDNGEGLAEIGRELGIENTVENLNDAENTWVLVQAAGSVVGDGYSDLQFVYVGVLDENEETPLLLEGVEMNDELQAGVTSKTITYNEDGSKLVSQEQQASYEEAQYTMNIHAVTVQATDAAVYDVFKNVLGEEITVEFGYAVGLGTEIAEFVE